MLHAGCKQWQIQPFKRGGGNLLIECHVDTKTLRRVFKTVQKDMSLMFLIFLSHFRSKKRSRLLSQAQIASNPCPNLPPPPPPHYHPTRANKDKFNLSKSVDSNCIGSSTLLVQLLGNKQNTNNNFHWPSDKLSMNFTLVSNNNINKRAPFSRCRNICELPHTISTVSYVQFVCTFYKLFHMSVCIF